jgi:S1-C subfamily serine protease
MATTPRKNQSGMSGAELRGANCRTDAHQPDATMNLLGMTLTEARPDEESRRKLASPCGAAVLRAEQGSEAFRGGVRSGDFIAEVNNTEIRTLQDMKKVLSLHDPVDPMLVFILHKGGWRFTTLSFVSGNP